MVRCCGNDIEVTHGLHVGKYAFIYWIYGGMRLMNKIKNFVFAMGSMLAMTVISLLVVSALVYLFKWQADKAMIGIIATYIVVGFCGGICLRCKRKIMGAIVLGTSYMFLLVVCAYMGFRISFEFSGRCLLIWLLIICSSFGGMCMKK